MQIPCSVVCYTHSVYSLFGDDLEFAFLCADFGRRTFYLRQKSPAGVKRRKAKEMQKKVLFKLTSGVLLIAILLTFSSCEIIESLFHQHNYVSVVTAPTLKDKGYTTHTCSSCGDSYIDSYVDVLKASEGLELILNDEKSGYIVAGIGTCTDSHIVVPDTYRNLPIVAIGDNAFYPLIPNEDGTKAKYDSISGITLPNTILEIGENAFTLCSIKEIVIPESVNYIGETAFQSTGLEKITLNASLDGQSVIFASMYIKEFYIGKNCKGQIEILSPALEKIEVNSENKYYYIENDCLYYKWRPGSMADKEEFIPLMVAYPSANKATSLVCTNNSSIAPYTLAFAHNLREVHFTYESIFYCQGGLFDAMGNVILFDLDYIANNDLDVNASPIDYMLFAYNTFVTDFYFEMTLEQGLSSKRIEYLLPTVTEFVLNDEEGAYLIETRILKSGYTLHFTDEDISANEFFEKLEKSQAVE